jgi:MraZ protein
VRREARAEPPGAFRRRRREKGLPLDRTSAAQGQRAAGMDRFVSNFTLRLDAKGRVSIPASYRSVLARDGFEGLYCYPALDQVAVDAGGNALLGEIEAMIASYPLYSDERDALTLSLYGTSETLKIDGEGRVIFPDALKAHAGISEAIAFVGLGHKFQIWEPGRFRAQLAEATGTVRALKKQLGSRVAAHEAQKARE